MAVSLELLLSRPRNAGLRQVLALFALVIAACSPSVPDLADPSDDAASGIPATPTTDGLASSETTVAPPMSPGSPSAPAPAATPVPPPSSTTIAGPTADSLPETTIGAWTLKGTTSDESGAAFTATVAVPTLTADVDAALLGRIATHIDGRVESQIGATLALWRSIEAQGSRDISGSTLRLDFDVAGFEEDFISLRFFCDEHPGESGTAKRQATTLMLDLTSGEAIGLDDIVVDGDGRDQLFSLVFAALLDQHFDGETDSFLLWAGDLDPGDLDQVLLTPEGLEVWFDELEVGPPEMGMPVVTIAYAGLDGIIDPAGPAAVFNS